MKNDTDNDKSNVKIAIRWRPATIKQRQVAIEKIADKVSKTPEYNAEMTSLTKTI